MYITTYNKKKINLPNKIEILEGNKKTGVFREAKLEIIKIMNCEGYYMAYDSVHTDPISIKMCDEKDIEKIKKKLASKVNGYIEIGYVRLGGVA